MERVTNWPDSVCFSKSLRREGRDEQYQDEEAEGKSKKEAAQAAARAALEKLSA